MQCFTLPGLHPRTSLSNDYRAPEDHHYQKRPHFIPEPDKNGRMWCPDAFMPPLPFKLPNLIFEPIKANHRNRKMAVMLEHINKTNFTTSRDSRIKPHRDTTVIRHTPHFRHSPKMPTSTATTYVNHGPQPVDRKIMSNVPSIGILPSTYPVPYTKDRCVTANRPIPCFPSYPKLENIPYRPLNDVEGNAGQFRFANVNSTN